MSVHNSLTTLFQPGDVVEVRVLDAPKVGVVAGYFNDWQTLAEAVKDYDGKSNVYVTMNPVNPALLARAANKLVAKPKHTTTDADTTRRRWFLIDLDPVRPAGIAASDEEKAAALVRAREIYRWLKEQGWPEPVVADSGNGYYLLYRIDLPNDDAARDLIHACLQALSLRFDDERVAVDTSVYNAARIIRLIGTINRKGDNTPERPHRRSKLVRVPEKLIPVPVERLRELAALAPKPEPRPAPVNGAAFDLEKWIADHGLPVVRVKPWQGSGRVWVLKPCPMNEAHTNESAFICRFPDGRIAAGCHHNSCQWWGWRELRERYEPGAYQKPTEHQRVATTDEGEALFDDVPPWPDPPAEEAYHGLAGDFVYLVEPHTEADPVALLTQFLVAFGNAAGRSAHIRIEADKHFPNEFLILCGPSAKARKGTSWGYIRRVFEIADPDWLGNRVVHGLSSGEGLVFEVRNPLYKGEELVDEGVEDKRLLALEAEFASVLRVLQREGNTLSAIIRNAWDTGDLRFTTKHNPLKATGAHVSVVGHITRAEVLRYLDRTEAANGFGNRFLWVCVRRSKSLPFGGRVPEEAFNELAAKVRKALDFARKVSEVTMDEQAAALWAEKYPELSGERPGLLGAILARAEAHVLRLALIYALLDKSPVIRQVHLKAALALWRYAEDSARFIFGEALGDPVADQILEALKEAGEAGLTRTKIRDLFDRNQPAERITQALKSLLRAGLANFTKEESEKGKGRPVEKWFAVLPTTKTTLTTKEKSQGFPATRHYDKNTPEPPAEDFCRNTPKPEKPDDASNVVNVVNVVKSFSGEWVNKEPDDDIPF